MNNKSLDSQWMGLALEQALLAKKIDEVPVGAVLVKNNKLIAKAHNQSILNNDPTAHAEIQLLRKAGKILDNYRIPDTTLYVTLEPCTMCLSAMVQARIEKIVFGTYNKKTSICAYSSSQNSLSSKHCLNYFGEIKGGVLADTCKQLLQQFFKNRR